jgi:hypothetical protein
MRFFTKHSSVVIDQSTGQARMRDFTQFMGVALLPLFRRKNKINLVFTGDINISRKHAELAYSCIREKTPSELRTITLLDVLREMQSMQRCEQVVQQAIENAQHPHFPHTAGM